MGTARLARNNTVREQVHATTNFIKNVLLMLILIASKENTTRVITSNHLVLNVHFLGP